MRLLIFVLLIFMSFDTFASSTGVTGFFDSVVSYLNEFLYFFTNTIPTTINTFFVWLTSYLLYLKFYLMYSSLVFAHEVALSFINLININDVVNASVSNLPPDLRQAAYEMRLFDALSLIVEAFITRLVYQSSF